MNTNNIGFLIHIALVDILISIVILHCASLILIAIADSKHTASLEMGVTISVTIFSMILITANHIIAIGLLLDEGILSLSLTLELDRSISVFYKIYALLNSFLQTIYCEY